MIFSRRVRAAWPMIEQGGDAVTYVTTEQLLESMRAMRNEIAANILNDLDPEKDVTFEIRIAAFNDEEEIERNAVRAPEAGHGRDTLNERNRP